MKFGAIVPVLNEWRFVSAVLGQLLKHVDRVFVLRNCRAFSGVLVDLSPVPKLDSRVELVEGDWPSEHATRNAGLDLLADCDHVFVLDSDEILLDGAFMSLKRRCAGHPAIGVRMYTYWKTPEWRIDPPEILAPIVLVSKDVRFMDLRNVEKDLAVVAHDVWMHHLSYVRTDEEMKEKLRLFAHAGEVRPGWYEEVWKRWTPDMLHLHPITPVHYRRAVRDPNPELLRILGMLDFVGTLRHSENTV